MPRPLFTFPSPRSLVVGSFGDVDSISSATVGSLAGECDIAEIRLDLFYSEFFEKGNALWSHLVSFPLLFTARCHTEGSPVDLDSKTRSELLRMALPDASLIDAEVANIAELGGVIHEARSAGVPWIASFHDFEKLPSIEVLVENAALAKEAGAAAFKAAAKLHTMDDLTALAHFQMSERGIPLATMGMGVLAPVSRLLCVQAGSVLNYGYIGETPTAPGQWSARQLRENILSLKPFK